ncbi:H-NS family nucleoid-associated regulatory protein [Pseudoruegeria sp. SK021]|uniref:H-NS histone family protein n=1 Tax=Pseudoruegeria sp. SK021 TaxID=1933035 RepID=UPI000A233D20|nr:H-NS histone family protein [Pseudoruegeria sp. SK021]OSP53399.1 transcriptional regulator [Pseudoruegeria sp. SK021]
MADINLSNRSLDELKTLQKDVTEAIDSFETRRRQDALAAVEAKAKEMGFTLAELTRQRKAPKAVIPPRYCHPENPELTWSGRGRRPAWIKEALAAGTTLETFLIAK